jgi:hypothetical protein
MGIPKRSSDSAQLLDVAQLTFAKEVIAKSLFALKARRKKTLEPQDIQLALRELGIQPFSLHMSRRHHPHRRGRGSGAAIDAATTASPVMLTAAATRPRRGRGGSNGEASSSHDASGADD